MSLELLLDACSAALLTRQPSKRAKALMVKVSENLQTSS